jgi:hypothetical protein
MAATAREKSMSTHTIDESARQDARRLMNSALLRMAGVAVSSIVFALIHCAAPVDDGVPIVLPAPPAPPVAHAATPGDSLDHGVSGQADARRN